MFHSYAITHYPSCYHSFNCTCIFLDLKYAVFSQSSGHGSSAIPKHLESVIVLTSQPSSKVIIKQ
uniref:Uncharacterized protein n=1 Tax=Arundo donax TaxID=35708 RepID=A0A0A9CQI1_ARUDO